MNAVMYGGGNIGRGFIGMLFSRSGYAVSFVDVAPAVIHDLNERGRYPVRILSGESYEDIWVENVSAVDGKDADAVAEAIASADIMATAVGVNVLPYIIPNIAAGIRLRRSQNGAPLNILICENLMDADKILHEKISALLDGEDLAWMEENVGLVECSIGRMVPVQTEEMKDGDPMRVCVERYGFLPVDRDAFKGEIPAIQGMVPFSPFDFYIKRKLYIHNMGHATCAYLGDLLGDSFIYESIGRAEVYRIVRGAMEESARALSLRYSVPFLTILDHVDDLLVRFTNKALMDTCKRVGGDPARKLSPSDRLIGSSLLCEEMGVVPACIAIGAAAGLHRYLNESETLSCTLADGEKVLREHCGLTECSAVYVRIRMMLEGILTGKSLTELARMAESEAAKSRPEVI